MLLEANSNRKMQLIDEHALNIRFSCAVGKLRLRKDQSSTNLISLTWCGCDCREQAPMDVGSALQQLRGPNPNRMCRNRRCFGCDLHFRLNSIEWSSNDWNDWAPSTVVAKEVVVDLGLHTATQTRPEKRKSINEF